MQQVMLEPGDLLDNRGCLIQSGYSTQLIKKYQRKRIKAPFFKIKEWDYYLIYNDAYGIAVTVADNSYMGLLSVSLLDFTNKTETTKTKILPFTFGKLNMPEASYEGEVLYQKGDMAFKFTHGFGKRNIFVSFPNFKDKNKLEISIDLTHALEDSMVIATPFPENKHAFYYNQKITAMPAEGVAKLGNEIITFRKTNALGLLDWGRGVWTYKNTWYWSVAQGFIGDDVISFNLGYGFGDNSKATENMFFINGKAFKLTDIDFKIPMTPEGEDYLRPWLMTSSDGTFEALFTPILDRQALISLGVLASDQHQVFGYFDGYALIGDANEKVEFKHFLGFAEKVFNKW
jgi:hypothetical protein